MFQLSKSEATQRLLARYEEQCEKFPHTRKIPFALYLSRNIYIVRKYGLLVDYAEY
jgi:hypothetical protein